MFKEVSLSRGISPAELAEKMKEAINLLRAEARAGRNERPTSVAPQDQRMADDANSNNESS